MQKRKPPKPRPKLPFSAPVAAARTLLVTRTPTNQAKPWDEPPLIAIITWSWGVASINHSLKPRHACRNTVRLLTVGLIHGGLDRSLRSTSGGSGSTRIVLVVVVVVKTLI